MKTLFFKSLTALLLASGLSACGSSKNPPPVSTSPSTTAQQCINGVCPGGPQSPLGNTAISIGRFTFAGTNSSVNATTIFAGQFPSQSGVQNFGQVVTGVNISNGAASIQLQPKVGANGTLQLSANQGSAFGSIQFSPSTLQQLQTTFGPSAQISSIGIWSVNLLAPTSSNTYGGTITQAIVFLYINGGTQPFGPIVF